MKTSKKLIKKAICLFLIAILNINTFGAIVSDNDGSAFITKAEFDALKSSLKAQIDEYNMSIDNKIDGAIAAYLAGISLSNIIDVEPSFYKNYSLPFTFHNGDDFLEYKYTNSKIINGPNINITHYLILRAAGYKGTCFSILYFHSPSVSEYNYIVKADYEGGVFRFLNGSNNYSDSWDWIASYQNYAIYPGDPYYISYAWFLEKNDIITNLAPTGGFFMGSSGTDYRGFSENTNVNYTLQQITSDSRQTFSHSIRCDSNMGTRIDSGDFTNLINHNFISNTLIPRYIDFDNSEYSFKYKIGARWTTKWTTFSPIGTGGGGSSTLYSKPSWEFANVYAPTFAHTNSSSESSNKSSAIYANNLYKRINLYDDESIDINFMDAVFLHCVEEDVNKFSFTISLDGNENDKSKLILAQELFEGTDVPNSSIEFYHNNNKNPFKEIELQHGKEHIITINDLPKLTKIFFKLIPSNGKAATINNISNCFYEVDV